MASASALSFARLHLRCPILRSRLRDSRALCVSSVRFAYCTGGEGKHHDSDAVSRGSAVGGQRRGSAVGGQHKGTAVGGQRRGSAVGGQRRGSAVGGQRRGSAVREVSVKCGRP
eukprot:58768-Prorocentrum_minimum.AAC.1